MSCNNLPKTGKTAKRYWYHVSTNYLGSKAKLYPRNPRLSTEPSVDRICVAPSVAQCLAAIYVCNYESIYIYRTAIPRVAFHAHNVCDAYFTKEKWLRTPTTFKLIEKFNPSDLGGVCSSCSRGCPGELDIQERDYINICKSMYKNNIHLRYPDIHMIPQNIILTLSKKSKIELRKPSYVKKMIDRYA